MFDPSLPYNDLPDMPPATELETIAILKKVNSANKALAKLSESLRQVPNARIITTSVILQEARASSEIENIVTTQDALYKGFAMQGELFNLPSEVKEVLRYREALQAGWESMSSRGIINTVVANEINSTLLGHSAGIRQTPTSLKNTRTGGIVYTPPEGRIVLESKLDQLWRYLYNEDDIDPLIKLALLHYQFEAIHPYGDGNGRTGRILNVLFLENKGLLQLPVLYTSLYIIRTKARYYELLAKVTSDGSWEDWVLYMLDVIEHTALSTYDLISEIRDLVFSSIQLIRSELPQIRQARDLVEVLFSQPYARMEFFLDRKLGTRKTISNYLKGLEAIGLVKPIKIAQHVLYINEPLYRLLSQRRDFN